MSLERMSMGAATAGVAMLAASVALGVSAWPGVALLVLATAAAGAQAVLEHADAKVSGGDVQALSKRLQDIDNEAGRRLQRAENRYDALAVDVESLKRRAALNSL